MSSRNAWFWAFTAALLLLALVAYEKLFHRPPKGPEKLLTGFNAAEVDSVKVLPSEADEIHVVRTNGSWALVRPLDYPAQANQVEALLHALEKVVPATTISGANLRKHADDASAYGLNPPRASLLFSGGDRRRQLLIGSLTAPGDQVFVQTVGSAGISVVDTDLLKLVPVSANMWRDTGLFELPEEAYDSILVTTAERVLELKREGASQSWQIVRPMQARADAALLAKLIQGLRDLRVLKFVSDDPTADREAWGLQPPGLEILFARGTNAVQRLQFGGAVQGATNMLYAVGRVPTAVVVVRSDPLEDWRAAPNDFRDRRLMQLPPQIQSIAVSNEDTFTLVNTTNETWRIEPAGLPADRTTVRRLIKDLQALRVTQFVKDVVAEPDLPEYGLASPALRVTVEVKPTEANPTPAAVGLDFGMQKDEVVYVRRIDENAVYAVDVRALETIPAAAGHFRELKLWDFTEDEVVSVSVQKGGSTWRLLRNGLNQWSLAPGSQGIVNAFAVEEAVHRLGELRAVVWTDWTAENLARYGIDEDSVGLTVELRDGSRKTVRFGFPTPSGHVYASTVLDGDPWVLEFPGDVFDLVKSFLINPSNLR